MSRHISPPIYFLLNILAKCYKFTKFAQLFPCTNFILTEAQKEEAKKDFRKIVMFRRGYPDEPELAYFNKDASHPEDEYCNFWIITKYGNYPLNKQDSIISILKDKPQKEKSYIPSFKQFTKVFHDLRQGKIEPYV